MPDSRTEGAAIDALRQGRTDEAVGLFQNFLKGTGFCNLGLCATRAAEWECCANHFQGRLLTRSLATGEPDVFDLARKLRKWIRDRRALEAKKAEPSPRIKLPHGLFIGHPSIDFDHLKLIAALNDIAVLLERGRIDNYPVLLNGFLELQAMHFRREEDILKEVAFPELSRHRAAHNQLRGRAEDLVRRASTGTKSEIARARLLSEMTAILFDDIRDPDLAFKAFLQRKEKILL